MKNSKQLILSEAPSGHRTDHLRSIIDFLKAQGNPPAPAQSSGQQAPDGFHYDRDGLGKFLFVQPLDMAAIQARFDLPPGIGFTTEGDLWDSPNRVGIMQSRPTSEAFSWKW